MVTTTDHDWLGTTIDAPAPKRGVPVAAVVAAAVGLLAIVGILFATLGGDDPPHDVTFDTNPPSISDGPDPIDADIDENDTGEELEEDLFVEEVTTTTEAPTREGRLFSKGAVLRSDPSLNASELHRFTQEGTGMEVLGPPDGSGWYHVRIDGWDGYLFGAFVLPPAPGWCVGTSIDPTPYVVDDAGYAIHDEKSGNKVLMTAAAPRDGRWPVVLPGGRHGYVSTGAIELEACG